MDSAISSIPATAIQDPERRLALAYAPAAARPALAALWRLDETLGAIVARTDSPAIGQLRLAWWHDALTALRTRGHADPILVALAAAPAVAPAALLPLIDGWEALLEPLPLSSAALALHADRRGATLFRLAAAVLMTGDDVDDAGRLWALVDLAFRVSNPATAADALACARALRPALPDARPLGLLTVLARGDARRGLAGPRRPGAPGRVLRALVYGATGF